MLTEAREIQPVIACTSIEVTEEGMVTEASLVQPENALAVMEVTEEGMLTEAREEHS
jgi:hypothetical protein